MERIMARTSTLFAIMLVFVLFLPAAAPADVNLLNASYDPTRELYQDYNAAFAKYWKKNGGDNRRVR
jgi:ABC-type sulfate transport system substrate-binding protein